jgi:hypothetical protein
MAVNFPSSLDTNATLYVAANNLSTVLNGAHTNVVATITVASTTGFPTAGIITIDQEAIAYTGTTGTTFTGCTRGFDGTAAASHTDTTAVKHTVVAAHHNQLKDAVIAIETLLGTTVTSAEYGRLSGVTSAIQTQLDAKATLTGNDTLTGAKTINSAWAFGTSGYFKANATNGLRINDSGDTKNMIVVGDTKVDIRGTNTNDSAAAGFVGEVISSQVTTLTNFPATGTYGDFTSISLTAGHWNVTAIGEVIAASGVSTDMLLGVSTTSGNSSTGLAIGTSRLYVSNLVSSQYMTHTVPNVQIKLSATTTVYFKYNMTFASGTPQIRGEIRAIRVR